MDLFGHDYVIPILAAIAAGGVIGFEREYRGRAAGIRTHILVCLTSAILMLAAVYQLDWMVGTPHEVVRIDPVRMAHGILTGIGFLCAGVIFREGFSVRGLTTAASLWITAALGILYGISLHGLAVVGTVATLAVLAGLRLLDRLPRQHHIDIAIRYARATPGTEGEFLAIFAAAGLRPDVVVHRMLPGDEGVELAATFRGRRPLDSQAVTTALLADPRVVAFDLSPRHE